MSEDCIETGDVALLLGLSVATVTRRREAKEIHADRHPFKNRWQYPIKNLALKMEIPEAELRKRLRRLRGI